jgi:LPXTG-motif cell wall-anchored protein
MPIMLEFLVWAQWLGVGGVLVALVACGLRRWRVAASLAGAAAGLAGLLCLVLIVGWLVRSRAPIDPTMRATLLASETSDAANAGMMALAVALVGGVVWFLARRRERAAGARD